MSRESTPCVQEFLKLGRLRTPLGTSHRCVRVGSWMVDMELDLPELRWQWAARPADHNHVVRRSRRGIFDGDVCDLGAIVVQQLEDQVPAVKMLVVETLKN